MALKEGQCPNCGSLLQLEDKNEQGHCLFCDAVFNSEAAFAIVANPAGISFPNLPQPKYEGPNLNPQLTSAQANARASQIETTRKKEAKAAVKSAQPAYQLRDDLKIPDLKLTFKTKIQLGAAALVLVAVIAGITLPVILDRISLRDQLLAAASDYVPVAIDAEQAIVIHGQNSQRLEIALPTAVTQADAKAIFLAYGKKRAALDQTDLSDFAKAYGDLSVKIVTPTGGFLIENVKSAADLDAAAGVELS